MKRILHPNSASQRYLLLTFFKYKTMMSGEWKPLLFSIPSLAGYPNQGQGQLLGGVVGNWRAGPAPY